MKAVWVAELWLAPFIVLFSTPKTEASSLTDRTPQPPRDLQFDFAFHALGLYLLGLSGTDCTAT